MVFLQLVFSLCDYHYDADFSQAEDFILKITENVLKNKLPRDVVLNVNIPKANKEEIKGIKICRQARANWVEEFDKRVDPRGRHYYWLTGEFINQDEGKDTDEYALENNYVSVVPIQFDLTSYQSIKTLETWKM